MNSKELLKQKLENAKTKHKQDKQEMKEIFNKMDQLINTYKTLRG